MFRHRDHVKELDAADVQALLARGDVTLVDVREPAEHRAERIDGAVCMPLSRRDPIAFAGCTEAWRRARDAAGLGLDDLSFVERHDCFTIAELIEYEAMGLTPPGQGARAAMEGWTQKDGRLPVNPSGGLKSKGHPIGATGVSMHVLAAMQLTGTAGEMQLPHADRGAVFNMGGVAVANYVSILESAH